jgi:26S proteasome regulatory subunit N1
LKEKLELLLERLTDRDHSQRVHALIEISKEVQGATSTITSVPKPLKFLSEHYKQLQEKYEV